MEFGYHEHQVLTSEFVSTCDLGRLGYSSTDEELEKRCRNGSRCAKGLITGERMARDQPHRAIPDRITNAAAKDGSK